MDRELVEQAMRGDEEAFDELIGRIGDSLHSVARRILRDTTLAEDATQQALLDAWRNLPRLRDPDRFEAWAHRLLVHACYAEARRERRQRVTCLTGKRTEPSAPKAPPRSSKMVRRTHVTMRAMTFAETADRFFADFFRHYPVNATEAGNHEHDGRWPDLTDAGREERLAWLASAGAELEAFDPAGLERDDAIDR